MIERIGSKTSKKEIKWNSDAEEAFEKIKRLLCTTTVLALPVKGAKYILDTDASKTGMAGVLSQIINGEEKVLSFASNSFLRSSHEMTRIHQLRQGRVLS